MSRKRNVQPFYHRIDGLLFTATVPLTEGLILGLLRKYGKSLGILPDTVEIESDGFAEPDPGDPADLM